MLDPSAIPADWPVQPTGPDDSHAGEMTCGTCGLSWNDDEVTSMTPTPSGRCPFEAFHEDEPTPIAPPQVDDEGRACVYLTVEQAHRLSALACDALCGLQFYADARDNTAVAGCFVPVDNPSGLNHFWIGRDGEYRDET